MKRFVLATAAFTCAMVAVGCGETPIHSPPTDPASIKKLEEEQRQIGQREKVAKPEN